MVRDMTTAPHTGTPCISDDICRKVSLIDGLEMVYMDFSPHHRRTLHVQSSRTCLEFGCLISGRLRGSARFCTGKNHFFAGEPGQTWCALTPANSAAVDYFPGQPVRALFFLVSGPLLGSFLPDGLAGRSRTHALTGSLTPEIEQVVRQVIRKKEQITSLDKLFFISKAYELQFLLAADSRNQSDDNCPPLIRRGVDRAVCILRENLSAPPCLADIARKSGLCVTSLNAEFKKRFGTTVFGFLRRERLERARILITEERMNASEAAWDVGYSSLSSFHKAFYARYGVTPGSCCLKKTDDQNAS